MKRRWILGAAAAVLILICIALSVPVSDPGDFTGIWYRAGDGRPYRFESGLIFSEDSAFRGAYSFADDEAVLFLVEEGNVSPVTQLYLLRQGQGDVLCERTAEGEIVRFRRIQEPAGR